MSREKVGRGFKNAPTSIELVCYYAKERHAIVNTRLSSTQAQPLTVEGPDAIR